MTHQYCNRLTLIMLACAGTLGILGCGRGIAKTPEAASSVPVTGTELRIGGGLQFGRLTIYPIVGDRRAAERRIVGFDSALLAGDVTVREVEGGGSVGSVTVQNRGNTAILIMAGTVIKGGKQDRQIGQDFVVPPGKSVAVDAYCVEHGRWDGERQGRATRGEFQGGKTLAPKEVRAAAHYKSDQGEVWDEVAKENDRRGKRAASGTLMATLDADDIQAAAATMCREARKGLQALPDWPEVVGIAYAVDGTIDGGRWFASHDLYQESQDTLLQTMVVEALGAKGAKAPAPSAESVASFLGELRAAKAKEVKKTQSLNQNRYRETAAGYSAETLVIMDGREVEVSADYLAK